ncbi:syntaxin-8-like isoform X2 [Saccoglossus kowalevskii]|uniref:Syntaxin-8-like n=1 Tax=Saccoglossus kowalevskii TaxID=10224 RepID=A0ABM0GJ22_SACKO|nr:PREDICTED: syntaxin-8-like [Saccoglossus kowalevskii]
MAPSGDVWLSDYDVCAREAQEIIEKINERNRLLRTGSSHSKISGEIRLALRQFSRYLNNLKQDLMRASTSYHLTQREFDRRQDMLDNLISKEKQLNDAFLNDSHGNAGRTSLLHQGPRGTSFNPFDQEEPEDTRTMTVTDIRSQQQQIIQEQDQGLEALSQVISRQKQMGQHIGDELDEHNEIIDDLTSHIGRTDQRLLKETKHIKKVDKKSGNCAMMVIIVLLLIAIVIVAVVPFH